jgi:exopolyphosphatase/guanosine-5'-triphosphate,3'-diphosphate pyrophosphatase
MYAAAGALRHGVLFDMLDREKAATDLRVDTVQRLALRFGAEPAQAKRVSAVACHLLRQLLIADPDAQLHEEVLAWAAQLHEIGNAISHSDAHKHGAYILDNADAFGFSQPELHRLSLLVLGHRGKLRKLDIDFEDRALICKLLCLRLAVILCHARRDPDLRGLRLHEGRYEVQLALPADWARAWPQSAHLLREECVAWQKTPWRLALK